MPVRTLPPLSYLQAFEASARHRSFTEAAKELGCTQAAISQRVRGLETYLSRKLFIRRSNGLELTELSYAYLPGIAEALDIAAAATESLHGRGIRRKVTISAPFSFNTLWLMPRLQGFLEENETIELRVNSAIWTDPNIELADIAVEVRDAEETDAKMPRMADEGLMLVCAPDMAKTFEGVPLQSTLDGMRRLHVQGKYPLWERWAACKGISLDEKTSPVQFDTSFAALEAASTGLGVTVSYSSYCAPYIEGERLVPVGGNGEPTRLGHTLIRAPSRPPWHPAHRLYSWLAGIFAEDSGSA